MQVATTTQTDRILRPREVAAMLGLHVATIWRMRQRRDFPEPIRLTSGAIGWRLRDIDAWIDAHSPKEAA